MGLSDFQNTIITKDGFSGTFNKFNSAVEGSGRRLDKLGSIVSGGGLGILFGGIAGFAGVSAIAKTAFALGDLGAQSLTTKASFENLMNAVGASPAILDQLTEAAGGTMTQMTLMQQANTALAGTTGQLADEMAAALPKLLEAGKAAARLNPAYGDAAFMFQSLVSGVKRGTPMLIDNTGIVLKIGEATEAYAASVGKSVNELTAQERSIAILRATLQGADTLISQAGGNMENMAAKSKVLKVAIEELKTTIGERIAPVTTGIQGAAAEEISRITSMLNSTEYNRAMTMLEQYRARLIELQRIPVARRTTLDIGEIQDVERAIARYEAKLLALAEAQGISNMRMQTAAGTATGLVSAFRQVAEETGYVNNAMLTMGMSASTAAGLASAAIGTLTFSLRQAKEAALGLGGSLAGLPADYKAGLNTAFGQIYGMGSTIPRGEADRIYGEFTRQYAQLELDRTRISRQEYARRRADLDASLADQLSAYRKFGNDVSTVAADTSSDIKGKIGAALTPTFDLSGLTGGLLGGQMGDTFDEDYKRLAAVALRPEEELARHAQDWADTFSEAGITGLSPEEAQKRAQELVEAYSRGLDFSLIDREKIKDQVRQAIKAEELYNAIVDEIYAEMGKERPQLAAAGTALGNQMNKAMTDTVTSGAKDYVGAWADVLTPEILRRILEAQRRGGSAYQ